jgi:hypothetical protein
MGRVEVEGISLQAHALNEGITDTMLEGSLRLESTEDGVAAVLDLKTVGKKNHMTYALRDLVLRSLRSYSLVVTHDGEELRAEPPEGRLLSRGLQPRKFPALKRLPCGGPRLMKETET